MKFYYILVVGIANKCKITWWLPGRGWGTFTPYGKDLTHNFNVSERNLTWSFHFGLNCWGLAKVLKWITADIIWHHSFHILYCETQTFWVVFTWRSSQLLVKAYFVCFSIICSQMCKTFRGSRNKHLIILKLWLL